MGKIDTIIINGDFNSNVLLNKALDISNEIRLNSHISGIDVMLIPEIFINKIDNLNELRRHFKIKFFSDKTLHNKYTVEVYRHDLTNHQYVLKLDKQGNVNGVLIKFNKGKIRSNEREVPIDELCGKIVFTK